MYIQLLGSNLGMAQLRAVKMLQLDICREDVFRGSSTKFATVIIMSQKTHMK